MIPYIFRASSNRVRMVSDPCERDPDYFDHVFHGFSMMFDGFGIVLNATMNACCIMFGWPFYLLSKLTSEADQ